MSEAVPTFPSSEAAQANAAAVTRLLNHYLQQHGIHVDAVYDACCLHLALRAATIPPPQMAINYISRGIVGLQAVLPQQDEPFNRVRLYGYQGAQGQAAWIADFTPPHLTADSATTNGTGQPAVSLQIYDAATPNSSATASELPGPNSQLGAEAQPGPFQPLTPSTPNVAPIKTASAQATTPKAASVAPVTPSTLASKLAQQPPGLPEPSLLPASRGFKKVLPPSTPIATSPPTVSDPPPSDGASLHEDGGSLYSTSEQNESPMEAASSNATLGIDLDAELAPLKTLQNQRYLAQLLLVALAIGGVLSFVYAGVYAPGQRQRFSEITQQTQNLDQQPTRTIEDLRRLAARLTELQQSLQQFSPLVPGVYAQAQTQQQLITDQLTLVTERLTQEEAAVENLQQARRFAVEAQQILESQAPTADTLKQAQQKWQAAIYALDLIPIQQFAGREARQLTLQYKRQYDLVRRQLLIESEELDQPLNREQTGEGQADALVDTADSATDAGVD
ncbi:MAG: hypothetical protein AAGF24_04445 [Cyanobacteria bacterium P01_H01_bin.121]